MYYECISVGVQCGNNWRLLSILVADSHVTHLCIQSGVGVRSQSDRQMTTTTVENALVSPHKQSVTSNWATCGWKLADSIRFSAIVTANVSQLSFKLPKPLHAKRQQQNSAWTNIRTTGRVGLGRRELAGSSVWNKLETKLTKRQRAGISDQTNVGYPNFRTSTGIVYE